MIRNSIRTSLVAQCSQQGLCSQCRRPWFDPQSESSPGEEIGYLHQYSWTSLVTQMVKNLSTVQETWVQSLSWEDSFEKGMTTHSRGWVGDSYGQRSLAGYSP